MEPQKVKHFGLHTAPNGVKYLTQEGKTENFIGLPSVPPQFVGPSNEPCPHLIDTTEASINKTHWKTFQKLLKDPLVREMLPIPKARGAQVIYFNDPNQALIMTLVTLSRLCSPVQQVIHPLNPLDVTPVKKLVEELTTTNIAPFVIIGVRPTHQETIQRIVRESLLMPRRLILLGDPTVIAAGTIKRETTTLDPSGEAELAILPVENLGKTVLRQFARGEKIGGDIGKR